jgi:ATP-dependent Lon protease
MKGNQTGQEPKSQEQLRETQPSAVSGEHDGEVRFTLPAVLPVLPLADTVIYPLTVQPLAVGQECSIRLIDDVMRGDRLAALVAQKSADIEQAGPDDLFRIGTVVRILRMLHMPDGTVQMIVQDFVCKAVLQQFVTPFLFFTGRCLIRPLLSGQKTCLK